MEALSALLFFSSPNENIYENIQVGKLTIEIVMSLKY